MGRVPSFSVLCCCEQELFIFKVHALNYTPCGALLSLHLSGVGYAELHIVGLSLGKCPILNLQCRLRPIFYCRVDIAHGTENVGGGHFSLFGQYLPDTDEIIIVDTNPSMCRPSVTTILVPFCPFYLRTNLV